MRKMRFPRSLNEPTCNTTESVSATKITPAIGRRRMKPVVSAIVVRVAEEVLAKAGPHEAVLIPRNTRYWFENSSEVPLVMFRISARVGGQSAKDDRIEQTRIRAMNELTGSEGNLLLLQIDVALARSKETQRYLLPLALSWSEEAGSVNWPLLPYTVARVRRGSNLGALYEAVATDQFVMAIVEAIQKNERLAGRAGKKRR